MNLILSRLAAIACAALGALVLAGGASAASAPNVWLHVMPAPRTPLVGATVTVTDATGAVVGTGRTNRQGVELMHVETGEGVTRPYLFTAQGGTVMGRPFAGTVLLRSWRADMNGPIHTMDVVSTAAVRYVEQHGGTVAEAERRIFEGLGMEARGGHHFLKHSSILVDRRAMLRHHAARGGFDGTVAVLVQALDGKARFPDWTAKRAEKPRSLVPQTRAAAGTNIPCSAQTVQASSAAVTVQVTAASIQMGAGLISAFLTKDPSLFLTGAVGMAMSQTPGMTTASMLASIEAQLSCISAQIAALQAGVDKLTLAQSVAGATACQTQIDTWWDKYDTMLQDTSDPETASEAYGPNNAEMRALSQGISDNLMSCVTAINGALFNGQSGNIAAWPQILSNYRSGDYRPADKAALSQQSNVELQEFLNYWATYEYEAAVLVNEYYNYQANFGDGAQPGFQQGALHSSSASAPACPAAVPSLSNVQVTTTNFCQAQQNIADVWLADVYTDEVVFYGSTSQTSPFGFGGQAISAVPASWGMDPNTGYKNAPTLLTPSYLHDKEIDKNDSRWNAVDARTSFNAVPATDIGGLNQSIYFRRATATGQPWCDGDCGSAFPGLSQYGPTFSAWLNASRPAPDANGSYASANLTPGSATGPAWQILAKDGTVVFDDNPPSGTVGSTPKCGKNSASLDGSTIQYYAHYTSHNTIYSPKPWTANTGGTIGGNSDPCSVTVPIAFLKQRTLPAQGTMWPVAPVIAAPAHNPVKMGDQLVAANCPPGSCTWSISDPGAPAGLTLSPGGVFSWTGVAPGTTASVQIVAGNTQTYSLPLVVNVTA